MQLCPSCQRYGTVEKAPPLPRKAAPPERASRKEVIQLVRADAGRRIKEAREERGLKQEELAKRLRLKVSQLHKFEGGTQPDLEIARHLERELNISLVEEHVEEHEAPKSAPSGGLTIGDLLK